MMILLCVALNLPQIRASDDESTIAKILSPLIAYLRESFGAGPCCSPGPRLP